MWDDDMLQPNPPFFQVETPASKCQAYVKNPLPDGTTKQEQIENIPKVQCQLSQREMVTTTKNRPRIAKPLFAESYVRNVWKIVGNLVKKSTVDQNLK